MSETLLNEMAARAGVRATWSLTGQILVLGAVFVAIGMTYIGLGGSTAATGSLTL